MRVFGELRGLMRVGEVEDEMPEWAHEAGRMGLEEES